VRRAEPVRERPPPRGALLSTPTALVTGAGRGIGRATVLGFLDAGWRAVAGVRDPEAARAALPDRDGLLVVPLDVTDAGQVRTAVAAAEAHAGRALACVVNNAAYGVLGAQEDADLDEVRAMFETNLFGPAAVTQAVLPAMRAAGGGVVVNVSSVGARLANPLLGFYHATKYGLLALSEALAVECAPFGIRVAMIEPGMVETDFPRAVRATGSVASGEGPYAPLLVELRRGFRRWRERHPTAADEVAAAIVRAALDPAAPFRVPVGADAEELTRARLACDDAAWRETLLDYLELDWGRLRDREEPVRPVRGRTGEERP
jgi:NAD(P)-dependent dehydrogenase (short-subunit alcohol dehydrogenase family)